MKLIIAGSRGFEDYLLLCATMDRLNEFYDQVSEVVCGGAKGADVLGKRWADEHEIPVNMMLVATVRAERGDALLAFWDGVSPGTKNMINCMKLEEKPYKVIMYG